MTKLIYLCKYMIPNLAEVQAYIDAAKDSDTKVAKFNLMPYKWRHVADNLEYWITYEKNIYNNRYTYDISRFNNSIIQGEKGYYKNQKVYTFKEAKRICKFGFINF